MDKWEQAIFGDVPVAYREWYEQISGTKVINGRWVVNQDLLLNKREIDEYAGLSFKGNRKKPIPMYQADKFQNNMIKCRDILNQRLMAKGIERDKNNGRIVADNEKVFGLMKDKKIKIKYEKEGVEYEEVIELVSTIIVPQVTRNESIVNEVFDTLIQKTIGKFKDEDKED